MAFRIALKKDFPFPVSKVFSDLADHESFGRIAGAPIERIVDGTGPTGVNGLGSVRRIGGGPLAFEETIVGFEQDALIEYRITKGSPLRNHLGRMRFSPRGSGSHLDYEITFEMKIPLLGHVIRRVLSDSLDKALTRYAKR
jgi:hypothetical protein